MSLLEKAGKMLEDAARKLQDSYARVITASHTPMFPMDREYDTRELERELSLFCHRARIHHRARYMAVRAALLEPPRPIRVERWRPDLDPDPAAAKAFGDAFGIAAKDIQKNAMILEAANPLSYCMVCGGGVYVRDDSGRPVKASQVLCPDCESPAASTRA